MVNYYLVYFKEKHMFKAIKKLLGMETASTPDTIVSPIEKAVNKKVTSTSELKVTAKSAPKKQKNKHTKATLGKMTKVQLEDLGRAEFGIELDRRKKKDDLVKQLLKEQTNSKKG